MYKITIALVAVLAFSACTQQKIAYVDSQKLMKEYKAVKNLEKEIGEKQNALQAKYQLIAANFQKEVQEFQNKSKHMSPKKGQARYQELMQKQNMIQQNQQAESVKLQQESQDKMDKIIEDVKAFAQTYAQKNGYTFILGSNDSGNVLYGDDKYDLTEEILVAINKQYKDSSDDQPAEKTEKKPEEKDSIK